MPDVIQGCRHISAQSVNTSLVKINIPTTAQNVASVGRWTRYNRVLYNAVVNRGEEKVRVHMNVVPRSTMSTKGGTEN